MKEYPILVLPLSEEDGGGYLGLVPDLLGCMSDGETRAEAIANTEDAIKEWIEAQESRGLKVPEPGSSARKKLKEHRDLQRKMKDLHDRVDQLDSKFSDIEFAVDDLREQLEHLEAWDRFDNLNVVPISSNTRKLIECS
uniref:HicB-like antitoxin of toxin-antitoxin system domain-containing protein n=1 Tax=biofilter metagenome TaxID=1070537 RepID=A0A1A7GDJ3_9ZZZZ